MNAYDVRLRVALEKRLKEETERQAAHMRIGFGSWDLYQRAVGACQAYSIVSSWLEEIERENDGG